MKKTTLVSGRILTVLLVILFLFHVVMLTGLLPGDIVWGGRSGSANALPAGLEVISLAVTLVFIFVSSVRTGILRITAAPGLFLAGNWFMAGYFMLNTLGNITSSSSLEQAVFIPFSIVLAVLSVITALGGRNA